MLARPRIEKLNCISHHGNLALYSLLVELGSLEGVKILTLRNAREGLAFYTTYIVLACVLTATVTH